MGMSELAAAKAFRYRSGMNGTEWQIKAPAHACSACGREFTERETFSSILSPNPGFGYTRIDCCERCGTPRENAISVWKTTFHQPPPPAPEAIRRETAETLLRQLIEENNPIHSDEIFVLAVLLERRRILVERDVRDAPEGGKLRVYEHKGTGETFLVPDPGLRLDDIEIVREKVVNLLTPPAPPADPQAADTVSGSPP